MFEATQYVPYRVSFVVLFRGDKFLIKGQLELDTMWNYAKLGYNDIRFKSVKYTKIIIQQE